MKSSTTSLENAERIVVCYPDALELVKEYSKRLGNDLSIWTVTPSEGRLYKFQGTQKDDALEKFLESGKEKNTFNNFPHPYFPDLHPLIKFEFLSLDYSRKGVDSINHILDSTVEMAYQMSIGYSRYEIRNDFSELIKTSSKIEALNVKDNRIYFPRNREKFEKKFLKKYWEFIEKMEKVTLFDFESLF